MFHTPQRLVEKVDYITSPGLQTHPNKKIDLITNYDIFEITKDWVGATVLAGDVSSEKVKSDTGFDINIGDEVKRLEDFTEDEVKLLRRLDVYGISHR